MEKPILFSTEMVRAILDGRKTQTRRVVKPSVLEKGTNWFWNPNENICLAQYRKGDVLWVRETFCEVPYEYNHIPIKGGHITTPKYAYKADSERDYTGIWKPSIHMPKEAARIWLEVTDVRVERLQEITGQDVLKEGLNSHVHPQAFYFDCNQREMFENLWNSTIKKSDLDRYGWDSNPWVWVIEFERIAA